MAKSFGKRKALTSASKQRPQKKKVKHKHGASKAMKRKIARDVDTIVHADKNQHNNVSDAPFQRIRKRRHINTENAYTSAGMGNAERIRVAVRQRVSHKRMLYFFEQLLVKHNLHKRFSFDCEEVNYGIDFFFKQSMEANRFAEFCESIIPCRVTHRQQEFVVELGTVCKGDAICLPQRVFNKIGGKLGPLMICCKVSKDYHFIDPNNAQGIKISAEDFFRFDLKPLFSHKQFEKYTVLDVRITDGRVHKKQYVTGEVQVQKEDHIGDHLGALPTVSACHFAHVVHPGDTVLCYNFKDSNMTEDIINSFKKVNFQDLIVVRKHHDFSKKRIFELKQLCLTRDQDFDDFLDEIEEDSEMRSNINLYKNPNYEPTGGNSKLVGNVGVSLDELLDGLAL